MSHIKEAAEFIQFKVNISPKVGLVLGSGLGGLANQLLNAIKIPYAEILHFPQSTVEGHDGQLVIGEFAGQSVVAMQGRFHTYEGYELDKVTLPVRVMRQLGVDKLIITNAAGGINTSYTSGALMLIKDHINLAGRNPLVGPNDADLGVRFPDMSTAYDPELRALAHQVARDAGVTLEEGVYAWMLGPAYETPAEIRMLRILGADAVGMSTVPEVIVARHAGIKTLGISCITNMAAGILDQPLNHEEVMETAERVKEDFISLVSGVIAKL